MIYDLIWRGATWETDKRKNNHSFTVTGSSSRGGSKWSLFIRRQTEERAENSDSSRCLIVVTAATTSTWVTVLYYESLWCLEFSFRVSEVIFFRDVRLKWNVFILSPAVVRADMAGRVPTVQLVKPKKTLNSSRTKGDYHCWQESSLSLQSNSAFLLQLLKISHKTLFR